VLPTHVVAKVDTMIAVNVFSKKERKRVRLFLVGAAGQQAREKRLGFSRKERREAEKRQGGGGVGGVSRTKRERRKWDGGLWARR
jgi:hypothetical protein